MPREYWFVPSSVAHHHCLPLQSFQSNMRLVVPLVLCFLMATDAFPFYRDQIPNGNNVEHDGADWPGVGHVRYSCHPLHTFARSCAREPMWWCGGSKAEWW